MKTIIALALLAFSSLSFAATLTIDNQSTQTWVLIDTQGIYPDCEKHPGFPKPCGLPPQKKTVYTLPGNRNMETFQLVSNLDSTRSPSKGSGYREAWISDANTLAYPLHGSANYSYISDKDQKQLLGCNTINKDAVSVQITIGNVHNVTCKTKDDMYIRTVDSSTNDMTITIRDL